MEASPAGIFDVAAIRQSCWQTCDGDPGAFQMDLSAVPRYRDEDTRDSFYEVATVFGCVDICEGQYEGKRLAFIVPVVALGELSRMGSTMCQSIFPS